MSDATKTAIEDAIRAHVDNEAPGSFLTDWAVVAAAAMPDTADRTRYVCSYSDTPYHSQLGLVRVLTKDIEEDQGGDCDDDD